MYPYKDRRYILGLTVTFQLDVDASRQSQTAASITGAFRLMRYFSGTWLGALSGLGALSVVLFLPSIIFGVNKTDSVQYNFVWASQFSELVLSGHLWPRWLPNSFGGLGSAVSTFYPPFAFYVDALVDFATMGRFPVENRLGVSAVVLAFFSGAAMLVWLRTWVSPLGSLLGAAVYIAAPYHLMEHYWRGAFAEFSVFVFIPIVALGMSAAGRSWRGVPLLAVALAGSIVAHLPTALLLCVVMLPIQAGFIIWRFSTVRDRVLTAVRYGCGGLLGLCLAGGYLVPALTLQDFINATWLWGGYYTPASWLFIHAMRWPSSQFMVVIISLSMATIAGCLGSLVLGYRARPRAMSEACLWGTVAVACFLLMAGLVPHFWTAVPFVAKVQFPWRLMSLMEFAGITTVVVVADRCHSIWRLSGLGDRRGVAIVAGITVVAMLPGLALLAGHAVRDIGRAPAYWAEVEHDFATRLPDADEYVPQGFSSWMLNEAMGPGPFKPGSVARVSCEPAAKICDASPPRNSGSMRVHVSAETATTVTVGRFFFPSWRAEQNGVGLPVRPSERLRFVQFTVPPGSSDVLLRVRLTPADQWGLAASLVGLGIVLAWTLALWRWPRVYTEDPALEAGVPSGEAESAGLRLRGSGGSSV